MTKKLFETLAAVALFFLLAAPVPAAERQMLKGHVPTEVSRLKLQPTDRLPAANHLRVTIVLPLRSNEVLGQLLQEVQNPASTNFHHYLDRKSVV